MSAIAGRLSKIKVSDDGGSSFVNLGGIVDATLNINIDELETTTHDSNGAREYIPNHHDATIDGSLRWDEDNVGQQKVLDAVFDKTVLQFQMTMQTSTGRVRFDADGFATNFSPSGPLDDTAQVDFTIRLSNLVKTTQS